MTSQSPPSPNAPATKLPRSILRYVGIDPSRLHPIEKTLLALAALLTLVSATVGVTDVSGTYGGTDIRNRVVGARVLAAGMDPYTFRWQPGMPEELLDPAHRYEVPRLTVPPTGVCLYRLIAWMPYGTIRLLHFTLEWAALLAAVCVLTPMIPRQRTRVAFLIVVGVLVAGGSFWRMHTERGQLYVLHMLLLSLGARRAMRTGLDSWWAGVAFGLAAALRPSFAPVGVAFLILGKFRTAFGTFAAGAVAVTLTLPFGGIALWKSYSAMGDLYYHNLSVPEEDKQREVPTHAEGYQCMYPLIDAYSQSSSFARYYSDNREELGLPRLDLGKVSKAAVLGIVGVLFVALASKHGRRSPRAILLLISVALLDTEFFLPQRWAYVDIHWLLPLALAAPYLVLPRTLPQVALWFVLAGLCIGNDLLLSTHPFTTALARIYLLAAGLTGVAVWAYRRPKQRTPVASA